SPLSLSSAQIYNEDRHRGSTLFAGSKIVQVKPPVLPNGEEGPVVAVVSRIGFASNKGELFRAILNPTEVELAFNRDAWRVLAVMAVVGLLAGAKRLYDGIHFTRGAMVVALTALDIITTAIPPALPIVLTVGTGMALTRLRRKKVFCIDPGRINLAGRVNVMCWDKTGTLTTEGLQFSGTDVWDVTGSFTGHSRALYQKGAGSARRGMAAWDRFGEIETVMATCHSLNTVGGQIVGYSVDSEMFAAT
ncbi:hypothetical protein HDU93_006990, partial [Gonapodya sp. JEL0774]